MKLLLVSFLLIAAFIGFGYYKFIELTGPIPLPEFDTNKYWGKGDVKNYKPDKSINKFQLKVPAEEILDLQKQLNRTLRITDPLEGIKFEYGYNGDALLQLVDYWRDDYLPRWKEREAHLNKLPQFTTDIQGLKIHFVHAKPSAEARKGKKVLPLLLLHGWPGSVREFSDFIPLLTRTSDNSPYVYEVVAPSLVGYGWSEAASRPGFNAAEMAIVMRNLMQKLNYKRFLIQGGDWGSIIGRNLATIFPDEVIGYHSNMCILNTPLSILKGIVASFNPEKYVPSKVFVEHHFPLMEKWKNLIEGTGYFHLQATKPDTIGHVLTTSPIGLAAYFVEKFQWATGPINQQFDALHHAYTVDAILDNLMIYYLSNTATTAARLYAETTSKLYRGYQLDRVQTAVPSGCIRFRYDLTPAFDWQLQDKFTNIVHSKYVSSGGHFAALEVPVVLFISFEEFVQDIPELKNAQTKEKKTEL